jgi:RHH-type rel operon transcriptional repressor/antitoxin RelB
MNERVPLEMPGEMKRLALKYATEAGLSLNDYILETLEQRLEDTYFLKRAEAVMEARERGDDKTYTLEEVVSSLGLDA